MTWKLNNHHEHKSRTSFLISFTFSLTLLFFGPAFVYLYNAREFSFHFGELCFFLLPILLLANLGLFFFLSRLQGALYTKVISFLFILSVLFWCQGNLLPWDYGALDGTEIDWNRKIIYGLIDSPIWLLGIVLAIFKSDIIFKRFVIKGSLILLSIQIIAVSIMLMHQPDTPSFKKYALTDEKKFTFSTEENIILLILDSFPSDLFQEIISEDPSLADSFDGFSYYRNAVATYPFTETSTFNILTGEYLDFNQPFQKQIKDTYLTKSILKELKETGYSVDVFPLLRYGIYLDKKLISNIRSKPFFSFEKAISSCREVYKISMFNCLPHFCKPIYYQMLVKWIHKDHISKSMKFQNSAFAFQNQPKTFKFFHLPIPHWPLVLNENLLYERMPVNRESFKKQAKAALRIVSHFLQKLTRGGVYDQSLIFIIGDHGAGAQGLKIQLPENEMFSGFGQNIYWWQANGTPLVLAKPFQSRGNLTCNDLPISLGDLKEAVLQGLNRNAPGKSIFRQRWDEKPRLFFLYSNYNKRKDQYRLRSRIRIRGHSWDSRSWIPDYTSTQKSGKKYAWGDRIEFGKRGNADQYDIWHGFSISEVGFTWTEGNVASIGLWVSPPASDLILKCRVFALLGGNIHQQTVNVSFNDTLAGTWEVKNPGEYSMGIPKSMLQGDILEIVFYLPNAVSPKELGINEDNRQLAIALQSLVIEEKR